ncbi:NADP-dependent phosphogluconate dehydrogenase [Actinopolymorpha singaporensis]|uniref:6-phosphogluconate dehydrogenase, decarboxylating n=1 Tax=Actinopolymorpha singaporensis TaxID=117157 RepID=A0A1H1MZX3_9ACTN|nr:NADP-dependent phosphogluconate dehydrogenase [Actinopolymorpha singaporensis]SDR91975.1 6-phosphogluconate dehydrogenase (decarboxylating) [Actinopolymorpha singaporensis]
MTETTTEPGGTAAQPEQSEKEASVQTPETPDKADIAVTGLATMGRNLARNLARNGHTVAVHNRTRKRTDSLIAEYSGEGNFIACESLADVVRSLKRPRKVIVMVQAGAGTDEVIDQLAELLEPGDILVDGGNAHFIDTRRRESALRERGLHFVGTGISGGEEGALNGPSIMPGGTAEAYKTLGPILESISAQVDGTPCCTHVGADGAGHFVKMVHNGIEYADMQLIGESYDLLRTVLGKTPDELAEIFRTWNTGDLESFLIEITAEVLAAKDPRGGEGAFVDKVLDQTEQKGTGRWTVQIALDLGTPVSGIAEAVFARSVSGHAEQRDAARGVLEGPSEPSEKVAVDNADQFVEDVRRALYASKVVAYAQGFDMIRAGAEAYDWNIDLGAMATIWRGGCIIRARFLDRIREAYEKTPDLPSLLVDPYFARTVNEGQEAWRRVVATAAAAGVPVPGFGAALSYFDALRRDRLPAALLQGLRDLFGAHTYRRTDAEGSFHLEWSGDRSEREA